MGRLDSEWQDQALGVDEKTGSIAPPESKKSGLSGQIHTRDYSIHSDDTLHDIVPQLSNKNPGT